MTTPACRRSQSTQLNVDAVDVTALACGDGGGDRASGNGGAPIALAIQAMYDDGSSKALVVMELWDADADAMADDDDGGALGGATLLASTNASSWRARSAVDVFPKGASAGGMFGQVQHF